MVLDGWSQKKIAETLGYHATTIRGDIRQLREAGELPPPRNRGRTTKSVLLPTGSRAAAHPNLPNQAAQAVLRAKAFDLKLQGCSLRKIATQLKRSPKTVSDWIDAEIAELITPRVAEYRDLQTAQLELYLTYLQPKLEKGDDKAINAAVRISERIAKLHGLDRPVKIDVTHHELDKADAELAEMVNEARAKQALTEQQLKDDVNADRRRYGD
jgi:transposase